MSASQIRVNDATTDEADPLIFEVALDEPASSPVTVNYRYSGDGLNTQDEEGVVTIAPGQTTAEIEIITWHDKEFIPAEVEPGGVETSLEITGVSDETIEIADAEATGLIVQVHREFTSMKLFGDTVTEGETARLKAELSYYPLPYDTYYTVRVVYVSATAADIDLPSTELTIVIPAGEGVGYIEIPTLDDNVAGEGNEQLVVEYVASNAYPHYDPEEDRLHDNATVTIVDNTTSSGSGDPLSDPEPTEPSGPTGTIFAGDESNDIFTGPGSPDGIFGRGGDDILDGGGGDDTIGGGDGDDQINGGEGNDSLGGGPGADVLNGNAGNDTIGGGDGDDQVSGDAGNDVVAGGAGDDTINGGDGADTMGGSYGHDHVSGDAGNDSLGGGFGQDTISGGAGDDEVGGGEGSDLINGGAGNDFLAGGGRNDTINGDAGNDVINGGAGNDVMTGGAGNDTFVFRGFIDGEHDKVTDFEEGDALFLIGIDNVPGSGRQGCFNELDVTDVTVDGEVAARITYDGHTIDVVGVTADDLELDAFLFA